MRQRYATLAAAVHLPFCYLTYADFLETPDRWFVPCAWALMPALFFRRRNADSVTAVSAVPFRVLLDVALVAAALIAGIPALGIVGGLVWLHGTFQACEDCRSEQRLGVLVLLPICCLIPDLLQLSPLPHYQAVGTTRLSRYLMDQVLFIDHAFSDEMLLLTGGRRTALSGLYSCLWSEGLVVSAISAWWMIRRRPAAFLLLMLPGIAMLAALLPTLRLLSAAMLIEAPGQFAPFDSLITMYDVSAGLMIMGAALTAGSVGWFLAEPVLYAGGGAVNIFSVVWNALFLRRASRSGANVSEEIDGDVIPPWRELISEPVTRETLSLSGLFEFVRFWCVSRNLLRLLPLSLPAVLVFLLPGNVLKPGTAGEVAVHYESRLQSSVETGEFVDLPLYVTRSLQSGSLSNERRFRLARNLIDLGETEEGRRLLSELTHPDRPGMPQARIWLVDRSADGLEVMSEEEIRKQLVRAVAESPGNADYRMRLVTRLAASGDSFLAVRECLTAVETEPRYAADLLQMASTVPVDQDAVRESVQTATGRLRNHVASHPEATRERIALARVLAMTGTAAEAERVLRAGMQCCDDEELRQALSAFLAQTVSGLLKLPLQERAAVERLLEALRLDAGNRAAIEALDRLRSFISEDKHEELLQAASWWETSGQLTEESEDAALCRAVLFSMAGRHAKSADALAESSRPEWIVYRVRSLFRAGEVDAAFVLADEAIANQSNSDDESAAVLSVIELLSASGRFEESLRRLTEITESEAAEAAERDLRMTRVVNVLDGRSEGVVIDWTAELSRMQEIGVPPNTLLSLLLRLEKKGLVAIELARSLQQRLIVDSTDPGRAWLLLGTRAAEREDYVNAARCLRQARLLRPDDPTLLNNLAIVLIRADASASEEALSCIQKALQINSEYPELYATRAEIRVVAGDIPGARDDINRVLQAEPLHAQALQLRQRLDAGLE